MDGRKVGRRGMRWVDEKELVRRLFAAINDNDEGAASEVLSQSHVFRNGFSEVLGYGASGVHSLKYNHEIKAPDLRYEVEELISEPGVVVAAVWVASGTPLGGGGKVHVRGMSRHRIKDGRVSESLMALDPLNVLPQLGS